MSKNKLKRLDRSLQQWFISLLIIFALILLGCQSKSARLAKGEATTEKSKVFALPQLEILKAKDATVNFCIENSGSMFGYVSSAGNFTQVVTTLAGDLDLNCETVNYSLQNGAKTVIGNSLTDLGTTLTVSGMNKGNVVTSDINLMLNEALEKAKEGQVALLVSDGIYSMPGTKSAIEANLESLSMQTRNNFVRALVEEEADLITYMVKFSSNFDGSYYPACGGVKVLNQERPYYVWVIGHAKQMQELFADEYFENLPGFQNIMKFIKLEEQKPDCGLVQFNPIGKGKYKNDMELYDVYPHKSIYSFSIALDFSNHLLPLSYFDESDVYDCNLEYDITSVVRYESLTPSQQASAQSNIRTNGATHVITLQKKGAPWGEMNFSILNKKPTWIDDSSNTDDCAEVDTTTTFGLSYLIEGISKGYDYVNKTPNLAEYKIKIKK